MNDRPTRTNRHDLSNESERSRKADGEMPPEMPDGSRPEKPFGERPDMPNGNDTPQESSADFIIKDGGNMFGNISEKIDNFYQTVSLL